MWKQRKFANRQPGFTLFELVIVLVIVGLLLAAVLKGQEMIENAKVKNVVNDLRGITAAYYAYQDRYKAIPGNDIAAAAHLGQAAFAGLGTGIIAGAYTDNNATVTTESQAFWQHTRLAGFTTGAATPGASGTGTALAGTNAMGGILGVQGGTTYAMSGNVVCAGNIPWKIALAVDTVLDDGNSDTGTVSITTTKIPPDRAFFRSNNSSV
jgi:prepilin-type N-terminal cleavage/methylation domain-containing protein